MRLLHAIRLREYLVPLVVRLRRRRRRCCRGRRRSTTIVQTLMRCERVWARGCCGQREAERRLGRWRRRRTCCPTAAFRRRRHGCDRSSDLKVLLIGMTTIRSSSSSPGAFTRRRSWRRCRWLGGPWRLGWELWWGWGWDLGIGIGIMRGGRAGLSSRRRGFLGCCRRSNTGLGCCCC